MTIPRITVLTQFELLITDHISFSSLDFELPIAIRNRTNVTKEAAAHPHGSG